MSIIVYVYIYILHILGTYKCAPFGDYIILCDICSIQNITNSKFFLNSYCIFMDEVQFDTTKKCSQC